ncbi:SDR family NAD(P)-dependent oxidoreductase [Dyadobacter sp. CY326]|uniref:SDR family NAD(P)-dependent oxidoreductase n=1 Tax=Dyadobacter sp. CY326 TaxID=2907300 RepID=UPI001F1CF662|nr:SDR family NAD(P)-dependent oxidoreductase [Dyadobacter sp. CY326]MCE7068286.1 SDR family NAD(P)-dependent oxidoreductase [Dyadobacter sp. CY326]
MQNINPAVRPAPKNYHFSAEALLGRAPIVLDTSEICKEIDNRVVLITGAAGSIGSELAWQLCALNSAKLILVDQAETALNDLDLQLQEQFVTLELHAYVADITDFGRMDVIFKQFQPQIIFHAAAYKHVPFMEKHPYEAIKVNVFGVETMAKLAMAHRVEKFVLVSTDKAVNPSSVMGATKRVAEMYLQALSHSKQSPTQWIITRFGNVLRSNGSFILTFEKQIKAGGPITVTHPEVSRYIMTASEACQLVLQACAIGKNGQILFFDMGRPVLITDIGKRMIRLSGLKLGRDIEIVYTGLRPGEKLLETLFHENEKPFMGNEESKICISTTAHQAFCPTTTLKMLREAMESGDDAVMISALKTIVPEYQEFVAQIC